MTVGVSYNAGSHVGGGGGGGGVVVDHGAPHHHQPGEDTLHQITFILAPVYLYLYLCTSQPSTLVQIKWMRGTDCTSTFLPPSPVVPGEVGSLIKAGVLDHLHSGV